MNAKIALISIITNNFQKQHEFYRDVLGFKEKLKLENYVEFESEGVRFAISTNEVLAEATGQKSYTEKKSGHSFELAFPAGSSEEVDKIYQELISKGAKEIKPPENMPWQQRTAFFADPDGNIHEIFADL